MDQKTVLTPKQSLNKAYLKEKVARTNIELFKKNLVEFLNGINEKESEEYVKNLVTKFLYDTYYNGKNQINTKGRIDLAIYEDKKPVVIIEAKRPSSPDMVSVDDLNTKATHELMLYYLQERVDHGNIDIKYLIITNTYEWFVFDASVFDNLFYKNSALMKDFIEWKSGQKARTDRDLFYNDIAKPFLKNLNEEIKFTRFDLREVAKFAKNNNPKDDSKLIDLFKILSPAHLLKQPFANDSNSLDTKFYSELLHIIGLEEKKEGGKKLIQRKEKTDAGSLLENAINILVAEDRLHKLPKGGADYGDKNEERLFNVALELCITWINRILFLKLLEGQLLTYHTGDKSYRFLDFKTIPNYDELTKLFFQVLARKESERTGPIRDKFTRVPYLNSSLFDVSNLEADTLRINSLDDGLKLRISSSTVLKTENGKKREGELPTLQYLFEFLDAYDFSSEGKEEIQEENKTLINASVLGLIFEKINGYKDGSFFTPGFITMYMCRETIRRAVVQKFNEAKKWKLEKFEQLYNKIDDVKESNDIINSLKICDPAVGSGHFLVSALNEIIAIKSELGILTDRKGNRLREYAVEVVNDELIVSTGHNEFFEYKPGNKESQRVQEALFHEKQTLIENCLFGVDINPNSVKICRLRLWIELLKNSYYTTDSKYKELETLPNIDINIKQGNSLISRFPLDADLSKSLKSIKYSIDDYRGFVNDYKNATDKELKRGFEKLIEQMKRDFRTEIGKNDPKVLLMNKRSGELYNLLNQARVFDPTEKEKKEQQKKKEKLETEINKLAVGIEEIKSSAIYKDAFEWRFEFPEVLDKEGNFIGFDVVIGNPPYISLQDLKKISPLQCDYYSRNFETAKTGNFDIYLPFIERALTLLAKFGTLDFIMPSLWVFNEYGKPLRSLVLTNRNLSRFLDFGSTQVFEDATVYTACQQFNKTQNDSFRYTKVSAENFNLDHCKWSNIQFDSLNEDNWSLAEEKILKLKSKLENGSKKLGEVADIFVGIQTSADNIYHLEKVSHGLYFSKEADVNVEIEDDIMKPLISGPDAKRYQTPVTKKHLLHPYSIYPDYNLIDEATLKSSYPKAYQYLKANEKALRKRESSKMDHNKWYAYNYPKNLDKQTIPKIGVAQTVTDLQCFIDERGAFFLNNVRVNGITPNLKSKISIKYLLGIMNSKVANFYFKLVGKPKDNGFFEANKQFISPIPIKDAAESIQNVIEELVIEVLNKRNVSKNADTVKEEQAIDQVIYQLYGLTEEEIEIVEAIK